MSSDSSPSASAFFIPPIEPAGLHRILNASQPGTYILTSDQFQQSNVYLTNFTRRRLTSIDDILLSVLSLIAIILCTQLIITILLRTSVYSPISTPARLFSAIILTEFLQFKFPFRFISGVHQTFPNRYQQQNQTSSRFHTYSLSAIAFLGTCCLFLFHAFIIFLTYPRPVYNRTGQYGLIGVQPVVADDFNQAVGLLRGVGSHNGCVTPVILSPYHTSNSLGVFQNVYNLHVCVHFEEEEEPSMAPPDTVSISSAFHRAGSDHRINFRNRSISLRSRAYITTFTIAGRQKYSKHNILFRTLDNSSSSFSHTRYLQHLFIHESKRFACRTHENTNKSNPICDKKSTTISTRDSIERRLITLWPDTTEKVDTVVSTFNLASLPSPSNALQLGLAVLIPGGKIVQTQESESNLPSGLIVQWTPLVGVGLFCIIDAVLLIVVAITMNWTMQPVSLGLLAWKYAERNRFLRTNSFLQYQQKQKKKSEERHKRMVQTAETGRIDGYDDGGEFIENPGIDIGVQNDTQEGKDEIQDHQLSFSGSYVVALPDCEYCQPEV